ncbi:uncharacterized protein LOC144119712 [Amblyomma americanum]
MAGLGLLEGVLVRNVLAGPLLLVLLLAATGYGNEGCGNTPDDSQMMSVLKQAADMLMPCIEELYHTPIHGSILEEAIQMVCNNYDRCKELGDAWTNCLVETTEEFYKSVKDFPHDPGMLAEKTAVSVEKFYLFTNGIYTSLLC